MRRGLVETDRQAGAKTRIRRLRNGSRRLAGCRTARHSGSGDCRTSGRAASAPVHAGWSWACSVVGDDSQETFPHTELHVQGVSSCTGDGGVLWRTAGSRNRHLPPEPLATAQMRIRGARTGDPDIPYAACLPFWARMASQPALAAGHPRFLARPFVGAAFPMRRLAASTRNLALLGSIHRRKAACRCGHLALQSEPHEAVMGARANGHVSSRLAITTSVPAGPSVPGVANGRCQRLS
jgi:hypothetical protein